MVFPRIDGNQDVIFASRLKTFPHTLVPAGKSSEQQPIISAIWTENITGRTAAEVASTFIIMLRWPTLRTKTEVILWLDNCGYQNKNYTLLSTLIALANGPQRVFRPDFLT